MPVCIAKPRTALVAWDAERRLVALRVVALRVVEVRALAGRAMAGRAVAAWDVGGGIERGPGATSSTLQDRRGPWARNAVTNFANDELRAVPCQN